MDALIPFTTSGSLVDLVDSELRLFQQRPDCLRRLKSRHGEEAEDNA